MSTTSEGDARATEAPSPREQLIRASRIALGMGGIAARSAARLAYRSALPLMAIYAAQDDGQGEADGDTTDAEVSARNRAIAKAAGVKALLELIEIASITHPLYEGATPYSYNVDGRRQAPHMRHILSLAIAAQALFERVNKGDDIDDGNGDPPIPISQSVAYVAVAPGEYQYVNGPLSPTAIRRSAMRERSYGQPQLAMLAYRRNEFSTMPAGAPREAYGHAGLAAPMTAEQYGRMSLAGRGYAGQGGCGCGCATSGSCGCAGSCGGAGCSSCGGCGCSSCGGGSYVFPPARRKEDGECASLFSISCETKWRVRECFKQSLCDLLRCLGDELCEDGEFAKGTPPPDFGKCLEGFVCSLVDCLPEAICPPPPPSIVCIPQKVSDCDCNFAVGS